MKHSFLLRRRLLSRFSIGLLKAARAADEHPIRACWNCPRHLIMQRQMRF